MTPQEAYEHAKFYGSSDKIKKIACQDPQYAFLYAKNIDKCPREDTREAVCENSKYAYFMQYILIINPEEILEKLHVKIQCMHIL